MLLSSLGYILFNILMQEQIGFSNRLFSMGSERSDEFVRQIPAQ
jgi:hypothetical protein